MNFRAISLLFVCTLLFSVTSLNAQSKTASPTAPQNAAVPNAAMTTVLPPKEAETLFKFYFNRDSLFGKQDRHYRSKETFPKKLSGRPLRRMLLKWTWIWPLI